MYTCFGVNRRGYTDDQGRAIPMLRTKITSVMSGTSVDRILGNLISVVAHKGDARQGLSKIINQTILDICNL